MGTEPVITTTMFTPAEQAAWEIAVERGLRIEAADLRAMLEAAAPLLAEAWGARTRTPRAKSASALAREAVRAAPCPFCGAAAGEMCRTVSHIPTPVQKYHAVAGYTISHVHGARKRVAAEVVSSSSAATGEDEGS